MPTAYHNLPNKHGKLESTHFQKLCMETVDYQGGSYVQSYNMTGLITLNSLSHNALISVELMALSMYSET